MKYAHGFLFGLMAVWVFLPGAFAQESGSNETQDPLFPQPVEILPEESGSQEKPGGVILPETKTPNSDGHKTTAIFRPTEPTPSGQSDSTTSGRGFSDVSPRLSLLIVPVLVFLGGAFLVGWLLFRMGLFNPYTQTLWPKRMELCIEIALRVDDFMTAFGEENFSKCQMSLDALNHLNGRRSILLSNEINAAVNKFTELAVSAKVSKSEETFQKDLSRQYEIVIEALRVGTRQEELSLEVLRSLTKAQGPHRKLKE